MRALLEGIRSPPLYINKVVGHMSQFPRQVVRYVPGISEVPPRGQAHGPAPWGQRLRTWQPDPPLGP